jgi:hypothetical protein
MATASSICLLAGCPAQHAPAPATKPFSGTKIVVAAPSGKGFAANWKILLDEWSEQTGAAVEVREFGDKPDDPRLIASLDPAGGSAALADLIADLRVNSRAANNRLATISDDQQRRSSVFAGPISGGAKAASRQKQPAVVPLQPGSGLLLSPRPSRKSRADAAGDLERLPEAARDSRQLGAGSERCRTVGRGFPRDDVFVACRRVGEAS